MSIIFSYQTDKKVSKAIIEIQTAMSAIENSDAKNIACQNENS